MHEGKGEESLNRKGGCGIEDMERRLRNGVQI